MGGVTAIFQAMGLELPKRLGETLSLRWRAHGRALTLTTINQSLSSATSFLFGVYLAKSLGLTQFGVYGIGFATILFVSSIANALFTVQMVVELPRRSGVAKDVYASAILVLLLIFSLILLLIAQATMGFPWLADVGWRECIPPVAVASIAYIFKEFYVRLSYSKFQEGKALMIHACTTICLVVGVLVWRACIKGPASAESGIWVLAAANAGGAIAGSLLLRLPVAGIRKKALIWEAQASWRVGRWAAAGAIVVWLQSQMTVYVTALAIGPVGVGFINTARLFVAPFQFISPAITQLALPRLARMAADVQMVVRAARRYRAAVVTLALVYLTGLLVAYPFIKRYFGQANEGLGYCVAAWACVLIVQLTRESASTSLQALRQFKLIMTKNLASVLIALVASIPLCFAFGAVGAVLGVAVGEAVFAALLWARLSHGALFEIPPAEQQCH